MQQEPLKLCNQHTVRRLCGSPMFVYTWEVSTDVFHSREPYLWRASWDAAKAVKSVLSLWRFLTSYAPSPASI